MNRSINLLIKPKASELNLDAKRIRFIRILAVALLFGVATTSVILFIIIAFSPLPRLREEEKALQSELSSPTSLFTKYALLKDQIKLIQQTLSKRQNLTNTFNELDSIVPVTLRLQSYAIDAKSMKIVLIGSSITDIESFIDIITKKAQERVFFGNLKLASIVLDPQTAQYTLTFDFSN
jgi:Tfp pilus assembly protein PilN